MRIEKPMRAGDFCQMAADLADEHGDAAIVYARRASDEFASVGAEDRATFWSTLAIFIDDIMHQRIDPGLPIIFH